MHDASGDAKRMAEQRLRQQEIVIGQRLAYRRAADSHPAFAEGLGAGDVEAIFRPRLL